MQNYTVYHLHSDLSNGVTNIDSVTKFYEYIKYANELGMKSIGFSEHGCIFEHIKKRETCEKYGIKYLHGEEFYITETLNEKLRDNYHVVVIAKNYNGYLELNKLSSVAFNRTKVKILGNTENYYYVPRITFEELVNTSNNLIITTACLGGILSKGNDIIKRRFVKFLSDNKERCFLEIQHHNKKEQIEYNRELYDLSKRTGIRLVAGTDTHCLNETHQKGREILQKSKNIFFDNENGWDLTFKTYDELVRCYEEQDSLPKEIYLEAIENTNVISDMVEMFSIDKSYKYPRLWQTPNKTLLERIKKGIKKRGIKDFPNAKEYIDRIKYELKTFQHNGAIDFMLLMTDVIEFCNNNDIEIGYGRGSCTGSIVAWILGITEMDSIKHNLNFERFMNVERVSLSDIDTDFPPNRRDEVKQFLYRRKGLKCCDIITFNTIALRGAIRDVARALNIPLQRVAEICDLADENRDKAKELYPELFEYVDIVEGTITSIGVHPCGLVTSDLNIAETFGLCTTPTSNYPVSQIYMKEIDSLNYVKLDLLNLDTIELINSTCKLAGIERLTPDNVDIADMNVWNSIRDDTTMIFQWESNSAQDYIKKILSDEVIENFKKNNPDIDRMTLLSIGNGAIRPAGASYREDLAKGITRLTGCKPIDNYLSDTFGYLVFQCQIIGFLNKCCGFTMGEADIVRRGFSKKLGTEDFIPVIKDGGYLNGNKNHYIKGFIKTMEEEYGYPKEKSEKDITAFIKVIEDASSYLFSLNHSQPYSYEGYVSGYLRYYYPVEFITSALNINIDNAEKTTKIVEYAKSRGIKIKNALFRYSNADYISDVKNKFIYRGTSSIKFLNSEVSNTMYNMRNKKINSFMDFLKVNPCNSRQTEILIQLGYFSEFGKSEKLTKAVEIFNKYNDKVQIKKEKLNEYELSVIPEYATETKTMYRFTDIDGYIEKLYNNIENKELPLQILLNAQSEYLGCIDIVVPKLKNLIYVIDIDTKYSPKLTCYKIDSGETIVIKMNKKTYSESNIEKGCILQYSLHLKFKMKKVNNKWATTDEKELWFDKYKIVAKPIDTSRKDN